MVIKKNEATEPIEGEIKPISEVIEPREKFYPDLERIDWGKLKNKKITIIDGKIIETNGKFGKHFAALIKVGYDGVIYTTITSGVVIVDKITKLITDKSFPVSATVKREAAYFDIV